MLSSTLSSFRTSCARMRCNRHSRVTCTPAARLFNVTRLYSHERSVAVETATASQAEVLSATAELAASSIAIEASVQADSTPVAAPNSNNMPSDSSGSSSSNAIPAVFHRPGSRAALQAKAGRKLLFASPRTLKYLSGSLPGDYGFDPLGLADPQGQLGSDSSSSSRPKGVTSLEWLSYAELIHGRWAMLAAAGALAPELLGQLGLIPASTALPWFEAGGLFSHTPGAPAVPFLGAIPFTYWADQGTLLFTMLAAMGFAELRRLQDYRYPGSMGQQYFLGLQAVLGGSGDPKYPGGQFFNMLNLGGAPGSPGQFEMRVKEVKHGRLAMVAWLGFMVQACVTHKGPVQNVLDHMADPSVNNLAARVGDFCLSTHAAQQLPFLLWLAAGWAVAALLQYASEDEDEETVDSSTLQ